MMMMIKRIGCLWSMLTLLVGNLVFAQKNELFKTKNQEFSINSADSFAVFEVMAQRKFIFKPENGKRYYWYSSNQVMNTDGGYDGKLLDGRYSCFYPNKNLREKGSFNKGLKQGEWKYWYENGNVKEITQWSNGVKNGAYSLYSKEGKIVESGKYCHNQLNGKVYLYNDNKHETVVYKKGVAVDLNHKKTEKNKVEKAKPAKNKQTDTININNDADFNKAVKELSEPAPKPGFSFKKYFQKKKPSPEIKPLTF